MDGTDDVDAAIVHLHRWAAAAKLDGAADSRVREQWARRQAEDEATLASVLLGLAERARTVAIRVRTGTTLRGTVAGVGQDYVALADGRSLSLVAVGAIDWVSSPSTAAAAFGDRVPRLGRLVGVLSGLAAERPDIRVATMTETVSGELIGVGTDVLTLRTPAGEDVRYVPVASVMVASVRLSG